MRKKLGRMRFLLFVILCPILLLASDNATASGENYIVRRDYLNATGTEYVDVVEYFDGLGRSVETVQRGITPSGQSLVTVREYDSQSRLAREWQPVVSPNTDFKFDRGGEITYRNDGEGRRMEVTHRISSASASLAGKPVPSAAYKTVLKRKYIDHFVYRNDTLEYILTPTGYIDRDGNYYHYQKDSRGSVRTVLDGAGRVVERNDYYPYGMLMDGVSKSVQPYKFGGKELDRIGGINHYDFHARQLQLPILHFYQQDPYADKYPHLSPYLYCAANPLRYVDPSGERITYKMSNVEKDEIKPIIDEMLTSPMFETMYNWIEQDEDFHLKVTFGETVKDKYGNSVPGQYNVETRTIIFRRGLMTPVAAEEFYHAYQDWYDSYNHVAEPWNREFEAKVASIQMIDLTKNYIFPYQLLDYQDIIKGNGWYFNPFNLGSKEKEYISFGDKFTVQYKGIDNYSEKVNRIPETFKFLIIKSYER